MFSDSSSIFFWSFWNLYCRIRCHFSDAFWLRYVEISPALGFSWMGSKFGCRVCAILGPFLNCLQSSVQVWAADAKSPCNHSGKCFCLHFLVVFCLHFLVVFCIQKPNFSNSFYKRTKNYNFLVYQPNNKTINHKYRNKEFL